MPAAAKILHITGSLGLGGTEKTMQLFVSNLDTSRFTPFVYSFSDGPRRAALSARGVSVSVGGDLLRLLQRLRPDIVHLHRAGWPEPDLMRTLALAQVPAIVETNVFGRFDPSPGAKRIHRHLFVSNFCRTRYAALNGVDTSTARHRVVYNPVDTDFFSAYPKNRDPHARSVGRVSRPDPGKWSALALDFLPHLKQAVPDFRYRIIGAIPEAHRFAQAEGLAGNVRFCDPVADDRALAKFYDTVCVLAHANDTGESFGMVIAEAMACGLPVVTHPCQSPRDNAQLELVQDGVTGFVANTAPDYASAVARLLLNPDQARAMGAAGREKAARLSRVQTVTRRLERIYDELLNPAEDHDSARPHTPDASLHGVQPGSPAL